MYVVLDQQKQELYADLDVLLSVGKEMETSFVEGRYFYYDNLSSCLVPITRETISEFNCRLTFYENLVNSMTDSYEVLHLNSAYQAVRNIYLRRDKLRWYVVSQRLYAINTMFCKGVYSVEALFSAINCRDWIEDIESYINCPDACGMVIC